ALLGNPPFLGGKIISERYGESYSYWLASVHESASRNTDLVAQFFRRAFFLLRLNGALGLLATNTIAQGDTREAGLRIILRGGGSIYRAVRRLAWPGEAAVIVSILHVLKGRTPCVILDERQTTRLSRYLVTGMVDDTPATLRSNMDRAYNGSMVLGAGFVFDDDPRALGSSPTVSQMAELIKANPLNSECIVPYLSGEDVNNLTDILPERFIIDFGNIDEMTAREKWPDVMRIIETLVRPERQRQKREDLRRRWWQFAYRKSSVYDRISRFPAVVCCAYAGSPHMAFRML